MARLVVALLLWGTVADAELLGRATVEVNHPASRIGVFVGLGSIYDHKELGVVSAEGSLYRVGEDGKPVTGDSQLLPNLQKISCDRQERTCDIANVSLFGGRLSLFSDTVNIVKWTADAVVAESDSASCAIERWTLDLRNKRALYQKLDKPDTFTTPGAHAKICGPTGSQTYTALLGNVTYKSLGSEETIHIRISPTGATGCQAAESATAPAQLYVATPATVDFGDKLEECRVTDLRNWTCKDFTRKDGRLVPVADKCLRIEEVTR